MNDLKVSIFANLQAYANKEVSMEEVIRMIKHDLYVSQKTAAYRQMASVISREEANKNVKVARMEAVSVGVVFNGTGKQPENVVRFTGLAMVDLDKIDNSKLKMENPNLTASNFVAPQHSPSKLGSTPTASGSDLLSMVKNQIMADPHTFVCYTTISGEGLRVIYQYQRSYPSDLTVTSPSQGEELRRVAAISTSPSQGEELREEVANSTSQVEELRRVAAISSSPDIGEVSHSDRGVINGVSWSSSPSQGEELREEVANSPSQGEELRRGAAISSSPDIGEVSHSDRGVINGAAISSSPDIGEVSHSDRGVINGAAISSSPDIGEVSHSDRGVINGGAISSSPSQGEELREEVANSPSQEEELSSGAAISSSPDIGEVSHSDRGVINGGAISSSPSQGEELREEVANSPSQGEELSSGAAISSSPDIGEELREEVANSPSQGEELSRVAAISSSPDIGEMSHSDRGVINGVSWSSSPSQGEELREEVANSPSQGEELRRVAAISSSPDIGEVSHSDRGVINGTSWRAAYLCGNEYYKRLTGCDYDTACSNYGRLSGLAHDPEVYYNPDAIPFVITDEMVVAANFAAGTQEGRPYKEQTPGSQTASVEEAWNPVRQMLEKRNMTYAPHHRHDYVLHACYLFNRFGVPDDELCTWADSQWPDLDAKERNGIIAHCYKQEEEHGTWRLHRGHRRNSHENSMITIAEIRQWLSEHVEVLYNVVTDQTMIQFMHKEEWIVVDDRILATLRSQIAIDTDKRVLKNDVYDVIKSDFARLVHPVRDYLNNLPPWDGINRVAELSRHLHAEAVVPGQTDEEAQQALCWALHKWHCAAVGTWLDDNVTNHEVFVLIGKQGIYKTTCFRFLLPPDLRSYFWENAHNAFSSKDDHIALSENCLTVIEEVEATGSHELSELKSLITSNIVKERRPYARFREAKHRLASFCATGNQQHFLTDDTGNRRWLCFKVSHIDDPRTWDINYPQLYAQLVQEFQAGFRYWFDAQDEQRVELLNQPFRVESDEEQLIHTRLRIPKEGEPVKLMNAATICQLLNGGRVGFPLSSRKISMAMRKIGFAVRHTRNGTFYVVFEIPYDQIQSHLAAVSYEAEHQEEAGGATASRQEQPENPQLAF